jgi:polar amino acid transport system ATP-binding protein
MANFLEQPTSGSVYIDGEKITLNNAPSMRKKIGMVFQHFNLFANMNIVQNIMYTPINVHNAPYEETKKKAYDLLDRVGMTHHAEKYPHNLSGGQKQRAAIARALILDPQIMLFDEPTSALDPEMVSEVLNVISDLSHQGMTILLSTHEMSFARSVADKIVFLDHGAIIEQAEPEKFFTKPSHQRVKNFLQHTGWNSK